MDLQELQQMLGAIQVGYVILKSAEQEHLEAFSRNAIYCWRGKPTMNKYKTVKEVCNLTGLTRKHLYYFHHEKVAQAAAYANYSVEGYNGYKLYDDTAVEKLQQIALYYQLGLKRDEIKDIMLSPNYDCNRILQILLSTERDKRIHLDRRIAALEYLILVGTKNSVSGALRGMSLDDLGRTLLSIREVSLENQDFANLDEANADAFVREFAALVSEISKMDEAMLQTSKGATAIQNILDVSKMYLGGDSVSFILGLFMSVLGEGSVAQGITDQLTPMHARAVIQYLIDHSDDIGHEPCAQSVENIDNTGRKTK